MVEFLAIFFQKSTHCLSKISLPLQNHLVIILMSRFSVAYTSKLYSLTSACRFALATAAGRVGFSEKKPENPTCQLFKFAYPPAKRAAFQPFIVSCSQRSPILLDPADHQCQQLVIPGDSIYRLPASPGLRHVSACASQWRVVAGRS